MTTNSYLNGNSHLTAADDRNGFAYQLEEPVQTKGFAAAYDRKFNCGNFESLNPAITIWVKTGAPEGEAFDLHHARERVRQMARENVRAQWLRFQGSRDAVFLGLQPPADGSEDPIFVRTVSVSLVYRVNLGNYQSITPGYTDWADLRHAAGSSAALHIALERMWQSLWANIEDEIARARGNGPTGAFFGLPIIEIEDLTTAAASGSPATSANGRQ